MPLASIGHHHFHIHRTIEQMTGRVKGSGRFWRIRHIKAGERCFDPSVLVFSIPGAVTTGLPPQGGSTHTLGLTFSSTRHNRFVSMENGWDIVVAHLEAVAAATCLVG